MLDIVSKNNKLIVAALNLINRQFKESDAQMMNSLCKYKRKEKQRIWIFIVKQK